MQEKKFEFDAFLSYRKSDAERVRIWAAKLQGAGLRVAVGGSDGSRPVTPHSTQGNLDGSRALVLFLDEHMIEAWAEFEPPTLPFRDPLEPDRRFIPVQLRPAKIPEQLAGIVLDLSRDSEDVGFSKLLSACRPPPGPAMDSTRAKKRLEASSSISYGHTVHPRAALVRSGGDVLMGIGLEVRMLQAPQHKDTPPKLRTLLTLSHPCELLKADSTESVAIAASPRRFSLLKLSQPTASVIAATEVTQGQITSVSIDRDLAVTGQDSGRVQLWNGRTGEPVRVLRGHSDSVNAVLLFGPHCASASTDRTVRLWRVANGRCLKVLEGHTSAVRSLAQTPDGTKLLSGADDGTIRLWDLGSGLCLRVFGGHTAPVRSLSWSVDRPDVFASSSEDLTIRLWDSTSGDCVAVLDGHRTDVKTTGWLTDGSLVSIDLMETRKWPTSELLQASVRIPGVVQQSSDREDQVLYTNAKVLLVGESGAGKTGLSKRLALGQWELSSSTVGAWATQWKLPISAAVGAAEREIWLWDFGGQADQRIIHQLYMDETSLVILVFDGQKGDVFDSLGQWDSDLRRASDAEFAKLLVAGRIDASPLRASRANIEAFCSQRGYGGFYLTSAKTGEGCEELKHAVIAAIDWDRIPWRSSPRLFKSLKEEIVALKDQGKILMRFPDLREMLSLRLQGGVERFTDDQLRAVLSLLAGPGVISELAFGGWILFQPQLINIYAQAVLRTMLEDPSEIGCITESRVLSGELSFHDLERVTPEDEKFILLAMHHTLLSRGLCSAEQTEQGTLLVFPSYYKRQRPELRGHPAVVVSYVFEGFVPELYSTLVVRLHYAEAFSRDSLWQDAADFRTKSEFQIGLKLSNGPDSSGLIEVYADPEMPVGEKILFIRYVHEHLRLRARKVQRRRHYVCPSCSNSLVDLNAPKLRLALGKRDIGCPTCDFRIPLLDEIEELYADPVTLRKVRGLEDAVELELDNESKERVLVGEVMSAIARAGQIMREKNVSDHGIDAELEFKDDAKEATGQMLYLQLKSGDSYIRTDAGGRDIFSIKKKRHSRYWMDQNSPVMLVVRSSSGEIRWMEIRSYLQEEYKGRRAHARQRQRNPNDEDVLPDKIEFEGEPFDVASILRWRARTLGARAQSARKTSKTR